MKSMLIEVSDLNWANFKSICVLQGVSVKKKIGELILKEIGKEDIGKKDTENVSIKDIGKKDGKSN